MSRNIKESFSSGSFEYSIRELEAMRRMGGENVAWRVLRDEIKDHVAYLRKVVHERYRKLNALFKQAPDLVPQGVTRWPDDEALIVVDQGEINRPGIAIKGSDVFRIQSMHGFGPEKPELVGPENYALVVADSLKRLAENTAKRSSLQSMKLP